ncbi:glycoside hydrolase family 47 protein [Paxillus rubicundulus Ve08.2h10]|uniref:alpha-1,2-Mannosidase n=1 Tax=Paxillus rubicundulus Ve08.2h10 TaxID=930991 RepID=A0A0D0DWR8_9AGAM|nr:glycoside hydrolase family 47 protein [Paxillus rubicundulus Ve08.2h10]
MAPSWRWLILAVVAAVVHGEPVQKQNLTLPDGADTQRDAVVDIFVDSYEPYMKYAWGHDDLLPVSESYTDGRNGWGASIVDAMSTMWIMGRHDWFNQAVNYTATVDFSKSKTDDTVSIFETTIRYVGGLLSAYELSGYQYDVLVNKAEQLAQQMAYAWVGNNAIPFEYINFTAHEPTIATSTISGIGSLTLEWNRLSLYTNNDTYRQLAEKSVQHIINMSPPLPGMPAKNIDPATGDAVGGYTWGSGSDSYLEYLIKYPRLTNTDDNSYADAWLTAVDTSIKKLLRTSTVGDWVYLADYDDDKLIRHVGSHLACFSGGNWILGGKLTNNDTLVDIGLQLTDACWNTYASTATGIGPEEFAYVSSDGNYTGASGPDEEQLQFYNKHGFYITTPYYILRPEVLESNFYAWRVTGDTKYLDNAASAIKSFQQYLSTTVAYTGIDDVDNTQSGKIDDMESFWFAEVLKYLYLTFDDPGNISLDDYVFNTEAHPFKASAAKSIYGSTSGS